jgi:hypothetical protein
LPLAVDSAFAAGLEPEGCVRWGAVVPESGPGVYIVALDSTADSLSQARDDCPISTEAVEELLVARPELTLDGDRPPAAALADRLSAFWLTDEVILYVGLAGTSLTKRVGQYYRTPLGARSPHAGGWFLKTLSILPDLWVQYATCDDPDSAEGQMLAAFCAEVSDSTRAQLHDPEHPLPFANIEWPPGVFKRHGIKGAKKPR